MFYQALISSKTFHVLPPRQDVTGEFFRVRLASAALYRGEGTTATAEGWIRHAPWPQSIMLQRWGFKQVFPITFEAQHFIRGVFLNFHVCTEFWHQDFEVSVLGVLSSWSFYLVEDRFWSYFFFIFASSLPLAMVSTNKMETPPPDFELLLATLLVPIEQVEVGFTQMTC